MSCNLQHALRVQPQRAPLAAAHCFTKPRIALQKGAARGNGTRATAQSAAVPPPLCPSTRTQRPVSLIHAYGLPARAAEIPEHMIGQHSAARVSVTAGPTAATCPNTLRAPATETTPACLALFTHSSSASASSAAHVAACRADERKADYLRMPCDAMPWHIYDI